MKIYLILLLYCASSFSVLGVNEILTLNAEINGTPTKLTLDTCSDIPIVLYAPSMESLSITNKESATTVEFELSIEGETPVKIIAPVMQTIPFTETSGILGWPVLKEKILFINWNTMTVQKLNSLPKMSSEWRAFDLEADKPVATIKSTQEGSDQYIFLDTGLPDSHILLSEKEWDKLFLKTPDARFTLNAAYSPAAGGMYISELLYVPQIDIDGVAIENAVVEKSHFTSTLFKNHKAILGVAALKQYDIVIDGSSMKIYMHHQQGQLNQFDYNRLGAVFAPNTLSEETLVAHVAPESPAYKAGIRENDELLKIDELDVTKWQTDSNVLPLSRFWEREAGTKYNLEILRGSNITNITVILEDFLQKRTEQNNKAIDAHD